MDDGRHGNSEDDRHHGDSEDDRHHGDSEDDRHHGNSEDGRHHGNSEDGGHHGNSEVQMEDSDIKAIGSIQEEKDADETPPLSPHPSLSDGRREKVADGLSVVSDGRDQVTKASTPLRKTKVNMRMASRRKTNCMASALCENGIGQASTHSSTGHVSEVSVCRGLYM